MWPSQEERAPRRRRGLLRVCYKRKHMVGEMLTTPRVQEVQQKEITGWNATVWLTIWLRATCGSSQIIPLVSLRYTFTICEALDGVIFGLLVLRGILLYRFDKRAL